MAYSGIDNGIKQERNTHFHELLHAQLSAEDTRNTDNNDSADDSGESPLDFSIKRKSRSFEEVSGSDSLSSPASSLNDTGGHLEDRKVDNESCSNAITNGPRQSSPNGYQQTYRDKQYNQEQLQQRLSPVQERIGQPQLADNENGSHGHGLPNMLNELQMGLANANMLNNSFPAMAALMDHRRLTNSYKGTRPFKAYPKDALALSDANIGIPQYMTSFANFENSAMVQGLNLTSEEVFSIYKQQLLALRERDKYLEALKMSQEASSTRTSTATSSSPTTTLPSTLTSMHHLSSLPPSISAMHFSNKNNGINNNILGNIPPSRSSSSEASSPQSHLQTNNNINCQTNTSSLTPGGRRRPRSLPDEQKDDSYWERRRKNNEAAKRSRDARRAKEDEIAIRAALLEQENLKLRVEVAALKTETAKLRCMLYNT